MPKKSDYRGIVVIDSRKQVALARRVPELEHGDEYRVFYQDNGTITLEPIE